MEVKEAMLFRFFKHIKQTSKERQLLTQPNAKGRLFPVPNGTVAIGGG